MARRDARLLAAGAALAWTVLGPLAARAQDPADIPPQQGVHPSSFRGVEILQNRAYWAHSAPARPFVSAVFEGGALYFRPNLAIGYGRPHWSWIGVDGYANLTSTGGAEYIGLRAVLPALDVRAGTRYVFPLDRYFLPPADTYTRDDTERKLGPRSRYIAGEIDLAGAIPLLGGSLFGVATGYAVLGVPDGYYVYEEALHAVIAPPFLWRVRLGFMGELDRYGDLRIGAAGEILGNPGRGTAVGRAGPLLSVSLTHHLDAVGALMIVTASPDTLGLLGADLGQLSLRYKWATGERWPEFP